MFRKYVSKLLAWIMALAMMCTAMPAMTFAVDEDSGGSTVDHVDFELDSLSVIYNNVEYTPDASGNITMGDFQYSKGDSITLRLCFKNVEVAEGQEIWYQIDPQYVENLKEDETPIMDGKITMGVAKFTSDGLIRFIPDEDYLTTYRDPDKNTTLLSSNYVTITGYIGEAMGNAPGTNDNVLKLGQVSVTLPFDYSDYNSRVEIEKSKAEFDMANRLLSYTVTVTNKGTNTATNVKVTDTFTESKEYILKDSYYRNVKVSAGSVQQSSASPELTWTIGELAASKSETMTYSVKLGDDYYTNYPLPNVTNKAIVNWGKAGTNQAISSDVFNGVVNITKSHPANGCTSITADGRIRVQYSLTVTAPQGNSVDMNNIFVKDVVKMTQGLSTVPLLSGYEWTDTPDGTTVSPDAPNQTLTWTIGTLHPGESKTLTYYLIINEDQFKYGSGNESVVYLVNDASVYMNTDDGAVELGEAETNNVQLTKRWIDKKGELQEDGSILFTVEANKTDNSLCPLMDVNYIEDTITGPFVFSGDITVKANDLNGQEVGSFQVAVADVATDENYKSFKVDFEKYTFTSGTQSGASAKGRYKYTITYTAKPTSGISTYTNAAVVGVGNGTIGTWSHKASITGSNFGDFSIKKEYLKDGGENTMWRATIGTSVIPAGSVFADNTGWSYWYHQEFFNNKHFQITADDLKKIVVRDNSNNVVDSSKYTLTGTDIMSGVYTGFKITFNEEIPNGPFTIDYVYTVDTLGYKDQAATYPNHCEMTILGIKKNAQDVSITYTHYNPLIKSAESMDWKTNTLTWNIKLNRGSVFGDGYLIEYIPEGLEYESAKIVEYGSDYAKKTTLGEPEICDPTDKQKEEGIGQVVKIPVSGLYKEQGNIDNVSELETRGYVQIQVKTRIVDEEFLYGKKSSSTVENQDSSVGSGVTRTYTNKTEYVETGTGRSASASATSDELTTNPLTKSAVVGYENRPYLVYTLEVNSGGLDFLESKDTITVVDDMSENMSLAVDDEHKLKVTTKDGKDITNQCSLTLKEGGHGFYLDVPDATALTVKYYVTVSGYVGETINITNSAYYVGESSNEVTSTIKNLYIMEASAGSAAGASFTIQKTDMNGNDLSGVKFRISRVELKEDGTAELDDNNEPLLQEICVETTDAVGRIYLAPQALGYDVDRKDIYVLEELSAPDGYVVDHNRYYIQLQDHQAFETQFPDIEIVGIVNGEVIARYNEYNITSTSIPVAKTLIARAAVTNVASSEAFSFTLTPSAENTYPCYTDEEMKTTFESGTATVTGAEKTTFDEVYFPKVGTYTFTLTEDALTDAQVAKGYTHDNTVYTITVTVGNSQDQTGLEVSKVTMSKDGAAAVELTDNNVPTFDNGYNVSAKLVIPVAKNVSGIANDKAAGKQFTFELYKADASFQATEDTPIKTTQVILGTDGTGTGAFDSLLYASDSTSTGVGTYYYILKETGSVPGFKANATTHALKVVVSDDGTDSGVLTISAVLDGQAVTVNTDETDKSLYTLAQAASWTNEYAANGSVTLTGTKKLQNENGRTESLTGGEFTFIVKDQNGNTVSTGANAVDGTITFTAINYTNQDVGKTYTYTVTEEAGSNTEEITYSNAQFNVDVTITDQGDGTLTATPDYKGNTIQFTNIYHPVEYYTLPNTGGKGTKNLTFSGTALITTASLMYIFIRQRQKHKKKGGANPQILHSGQ